jgi:glutathione S-transferase
MSLTYYYCPKSSAERTTWALEELSVPCERVLVDFRKKETQSEDFLKLNPNGKIPLLVVDGHPIFESLAILIYLGETYGVQPGLYPAPGLERAESLKWMVWATASLLEAIQRYVANSAEHVPAEQRNARAAEVAREDLERMLAILDRALADRPYLVGGRFTLADLAVCGFVPYLQFVGYDISHHPHIQPWVERCFSRPAARRGLGL